MAKDANRYSFGIVFDIIALIISFAAVAFVRAAGPAGIEVSEIWLLFIFGAVFIVIFYMFEMYKITLIDYKGIAVTVILTAVYSGVISWIAAALLYIPSSHTLFIPEYTLLSMFSVGLWRLLYHFYAVRRKDKPHMLILAENMEDNSRVRKIKYSSFRIFNSWYEQINLSDRKAIGEIIESFTDYDIICLMDSIPLEIRDMMVQAAINGGRPLFIVSTAYDISFSRPRLALFDDVLMFNIRSNGISLPERTIKRAVDIICSLLGIIIFSLPMLFVAAAVKLTSPGPVFYLQERYTRGKKVFKIIKFRTMRVDSEKTTGPVFAQKDDPRITKVGKFLRKARLDELPQLFNILAGDMSVVGPRPERPFFAERFEREVDNYERRFTVKAGLTSLSHVYGRYSTEIIDRTMCDFLYIANYSLPLDFKIMLMTTRIIFLGEAAEGITNEYKVRRETKPDGAAVNKTYTLV